MSVQTFDPDRLDPERTTGTLAPDEERPAEGPALPRWTLGPGGDFEPDGVLGEGGMSVVLRATQHAPRRSVALKRPRSPGKVTEVRALLREGEVTAQVEHPNVVPVHAIGEDEQGDPVVVLRELRGRTLAQEPRPGDAAGWRRLVGVLVAVCHALEAAHHRGYVHCDVKTANVLLGEFGETWLVDWGIAQRKGTAAGYPRGTPGYFAPEQARGLAVDERTDVYLLGATLHHLLAGHPRHQGDDLASYAAAAGRASATAWPPDAPAELGALADRCCRPEPSERPADVRAVREALEAWGASSHLDGLVDAALRELELGLDPAADAVERRVRLVKAQFALAAAAAVPRARAGLCRALDALIDDDLRAGNVVSARSWVAGHPDWSPAREAAAAAREGALLASEAERRRAVRDWGLGGQRTRLVAQMSAMGVAVTLVAAVALSVQAAGLFTDVQVVRAAVSTVLLGVYLVGRHLALRRGDVGHLTRSLLDGGVAFLMLLTFSRLLLGVWMRAPSALSTMADLATTAAWSVGWWPVFRSAPLVLLVSAALMVCHARWPEHEALVLNLQVAGLLAVLGIELLRDDSREQRVSRER